MTRHETRENRAADAPPRILLAAGGTGGHLYPAQALAAELAQRGVEVHLATDRRTHDRAAGFAELAGLHEIPARPLGRGLRGKARTATALLRGTLTARRLIARLAPAAVVGFGGYVTAPTALAARAARRPLVLHEQNAVLGRTNRYLARRADLIASGFAELAGLPARLRAPVLATGNPVRAEIAALSATADPEDGPAPAPAGPREAEAGDKLHLLITGGSQGAAIFAAVLPAALARLPRSVRARLRVTQQAREADLEGLARAWRCLGVEAEIAAFFDDMPRRLAACDLAIARAGASTLAELAAAGRPAILVPYPHAMDNHQLINAEQIQAAGGGWVMPQSAFTAEALASRLECLLQHPAALTQAARAARRRHLPDAAGRLADAVLALAGGANVDPRAGGPAAPGGGAGIAPDGTRPRPRADAAARVELAYLRDLARLEAAE